MNLPENGRIVIIDNNRDEAMPLISVLSKNGFAATYFDADVRNLPSRPLKGIRILFQDMVLTAESKDDKIIMSAVKSMLDKILDKDNGPFITIAWTHRPDLTAQLDGYLKQRGFHFPVFCWEKNNFVKNDGSGEYDMNRIVEKIKTSLQGKEALQLCVHWENLVHRAAGKTIDEFSRLKPFDEDKWNEKMVSVFWKLAKGYTGKQLEKNKPEEVIRNSLYSFNGAFSDTLYSEIRLDAECGHIQMSFESVDDGEDTATNGKINTKFMITEADGQKNLPGTVYENLNVSRITLQDIFHEHNGKKYATVKDELESKVKYIFLEVTPACDYAQDKWKVNRILPGVMWPAGFAEYIKTSAKFVYKSPVLQYKDEKYYHLVFDLRYFTSVPFSTLEPITPIFRIKQELLIDIQSHLASHVNRPGVVSLE